jgi:hypothetical protein
MPAVDEDQAPRESIATLSLPPERSSRGLVDPESSYPWK